MWKAQALLVQLLLLVCLLRLFFQPGALEHPEPQKTLPELGLPQPAERLVLFLVEGLRAETFFGSNFQHVTHLRELLSKHGLVGVSRTTVPTLTRSGEVALLAGFYDGSSLLVDEGFDTIYNRTSSGPNTVVLKFSGSPRKVFKKVEASLKDVDTYNRLRIATRSVIGLQMEGLTAESPLDERYQAKFRNAQWTVRETYHMFERVFADQATVYLMTSAHGLTDLGSHGGATLRETRTPFYLWGAGVNRLADNFSSLELHNGTHMPLHKLDQIQLVPLVSALIGLPPPINNLGVLPQGYMMVTPEYMRKAMDLNALQLLALAKEKIRKHESGIFSKWLPSSMDLDLSRIAYYQNQMDRLLEMGTIGKAMETSQLAAELSLKTLKYYSTYLHIPVQVTTVLALLGWMYLLMIKISKDAMESNEKCRGFVQCSTVTLLSLGLLVAELVFMQCSSLLTVLCVLAPFGGWCVTLAEMPAEGRSVLAPFKHLVWILAMGGGILYALHCRRCFFSIIFVCSVLIYNRLGWRYFSAKFLAWLALVFLLSGFLWSQPAMQILMTPEYRISLQAAGMLMAVVRPWVLKHQFPAHVWLLNASALVSGGVGLYFYEMGKPVPIYIIAGSWIHLIHATLSLAFCANTGPRNRWELICFNLLTIHALLSDSYSSLFVQALVTEYQMGLEVHEESKELDEEEQADEEMQKEELMTPLQYLHLSYRFAASILLYFFASLLGSGHWIGSFTYLGNTARLFLPEPYAVPMAVLVLIHLLIPVFVILSSLRAKSTFARLEARPILTCLMLICNGVVLFYVAFVDHRADWPLVHPLVISVILVILATILILSCESLVDVLFREFSLKVPGMKRVAHESQLPNLSQSQNED
ncbi:hypothetical protein KR026_011461 [Drosophila bipectinata]|nr:hypothetical protein KR026_011461 [Drosophila bipectinata]